MKKCRLPPLFSQGRSQGCQMRELVALSPGGEVRRRAENQACRARTSSAKVAEQRCLRWGPGGGTRAQASLAWSLTCSGHLGDHMSDGGGEPPAAHGCPTLRQAPLGTISRSQDSPVAPQGPCLHPRLWEVRQSATREWGWNARPQA